MAVKPEPPAPLAPPAPEAAAQADNTSDVIRQIDALVDQQKSGNIEWRIAELCSVFRGFSKGGTNRLSTQAVTAYAGVFTAWSRFPSFRALPFRLARRARKYASQELVVAFLENGEDGLKALLPRRSQTQWQTVIKAISRAIARGVAVEKIVEAVDAL
jgi:hypothetical protein